MAHAKPVIGGDTKKKLRKNKRRADSKKKHKGKSVPLFSTEGAMRMGDREKAAAAKAKKRRDTKADRIARGTRLMEELGKIGFKKKKK